MYGLQDDTLSFHSPGLDPETEIFYKQVLKKLNENNVPYLIGGAYAMAAYTGYVRHTKDLDLFVRPSQVDSICGLLEHSGFRTEVICSTWLAKAYSGNGEFVDFIFRSGNGLAEVTDEWFEHGSEATLLGVPVRLCAPEETVYSKAFVMERGRYDGADIAHYFLACAGNMDWERLLRHFGSHWRVLYSHLTLFGYIYPGKRLLIPPQIMRRLLRQLEAELDSDCKELTNVCRGTLLSRAYYLPDVEPGGLEDGRFHSSDSLSREELHEWRRRLDRETPRMLRESGICLDETVLRKAC